MSQLTVDQLFRSPLFSVRDVHCHAADTRRGGEELALADAIVFTRSGVFHHRRLEDRRDVIAEPAHVVFFAAHEPYRISHPTRGGDECTSFEYPREAVLDALEPFDPWARDRRSGLFAHLDALVAADLAMEIQRVRALLRDSDGAPSGLEGDELGLSVLRRSIAAAFDGRGFPRAHRRVASSEKIERTKVLVASDPAADRTLAEIAAGVNSSPFHLARRFREDVGISIHQYRLRLRLSLALDHLVDGAQRATDLSALALDLGFSHHSHFTTAFRRAFGIPPSRMRRFGTSRQVAAARRTLAARGSHTRSR
jgi:AraC-like DNA-binding protein